MVVILGIWVGLVGLYHEMESYGEWLPAISIQDLRRQITAASQGD